MARPNTADRRAHADLVRALADTGFALPGSLLERRLPCGKRNCRCKADPPELHGPYYQWTRKINGKTVTRWLTSEQLTRYQDWFANAKRARDLFTQLENLSLAIAEDTEDWS